MRAVECDHRIGAKATPSAAGLCECTQQNSMHAFCVSCYLPCHCRGASPVSHVRRLMEVLLDEFTHTRAFSAIDRQPNCLVPSLPASLYCTWILTLLSFRFLSCARAHFVQRGVEHREAFFPYSTARGRTRRVIDSV